MVYQKCCNRLQHVFVSVLTGRDLSVFQHAQPTLKEIFFAYFSTTKPDRLDRRTPWAISHISVPVSQDKVEQYKQLLNLTITVSLT